MNMILLVLSASRRFLITSSQWQEYGKIFGGSVGPEKCQILSFKVSMISY